MFGISCFFLFFKFRSFKLGGELSGSPPAAPMLAELAYEEQETFKFH
jgi:hypothetical protein